MIVVLHVDDNDLWLENIANHIKEVRIAGQPQPVEVLSRASVNEARNVILGTDRQMQRLAAQGHRLHGVILDLMIAGGTKKDLDGWLETVKSLAGKPPERELAAIDAKCQVLPLGRLAAERGAKVIVLTNVSTFLDETEMPAKRQRELVMAAANASAYVVKDDGSCYREIQRALSR